jgi:hypothetical protein
MLAQRLWQSWWPMGPASVAVPAAAIVVVVVAMTWPMLDWPFPLWVQTSAQFHEQFTWAGPIAGTSACWYATVLHPKNRIWMQPGAPRGGTPAVIRHLTVLVGWLVGAYLVALLPLVVSTVLADGIGTPDLLAMLSGVLAMVAAVALGYAVGTIMPSPATVPIVAAGFYALLVVGRAEGERYATVAPVLYLEPELGQRESLPLLVFRIALFIAVTAAAIGLAGKSLSRTATGTAQPWRTIADVAAHLAVPGMLVIVSLIRQPVVLATDDQPLATCTERREIRYCVHPGNQPRLAELVDTVDPMIVRFGDKPTNLDQIWDYALTLHPIDVNVARGLEVAWLNPDGTLETQIADTIAGVHACAGEDQGQRSEGEPDNLTHAAADISAYLSTGTPSGMFSGMSVADMQQWISQHKEQLHTCTLPSDQLPKPDDVNAPG